MSRPAEEPEGRNLQEHDVIAVALRTVSGVGDGSEHRDVLLRAFQCPDVVGPQDDIHLTAKERGPRGKV